MGRGKKSKKEAAGKAKFSAFPAAKFCGFLRYKKNGASDRNRTGDNHVGNVMLYQLSYTRLKQCLNIFLQNGKVKRGDP